MFLGAPGEERDENGNNVLHQAGAVYVYELDSSGSWGETQKIISPNRNAYDAFGGSVAYKDGQLFIGSRSHDYDENDTNYQANAGAVFVYEMNSGGSWQLFQKIVASNRNLTGSVLFGSSVAMSQNGLFVGSYAGYDQNNANFMTNAGSVYAFELDSSGYWVEKQIIVPLDRYYQDFFASWTEIVATDSALFVCAPYNSYDENGQNYVNRAGAVYYFKQDTTGNWVQQQKIMRAQRSMIDNFGTYIHSNGEYLFSRGQEWDHYLSNDSLSVFRLVNGVFVQVQSLFYSTPNQADAGSALGKSCVFVGDTVFVGVPGNEAWSYPTWSSYQGEGLVHMYVKSADTFSLEQTVYPCTSEDTIGLGRKLAYENGQLISASSHLCYDESDSNYILYTGGAFAFKPCNQSFIDSLSFDSLMLCGYDSFQVSIAGLSSLGSATTWGFYADSLGQNLLDTNQLGVFNWSVDSSSTFYIRSIGGCESSCLEFESFYVEIHEPDSVSLSITTCDSVYVGGQWIDSSQTVIQTLSNQFGCDSVVTYNVTVNYSVHAFDSVIGIDSVVIYGFVFYESTTTDTTFAGAAQNGCDSTVTYEIIVNPLLMLRGETTSEHFGHDGTIDLIIDQGTAPYIYDWIHDGQGDWDDSQDLDSLTAGGYKVFVRDATGQEVSLSLVVENALGIKEKAFETLIIYPNPTQMQATVQSDQIIDRIDIKSLTGETVEVIQVNDLQVQLNFAGYSRGLYFIQITSGDVVTSRRVILD